MGLEAIAKPTNIIKIKNADDLIKSAGKFQKGKSGLINDGPIKGNANEIFGKITQGGKTRPSGAVEMSDGTIINLHKSSKTKEHFKTIDINKGGKIYKIRIQE